MISRGVEERVLTGFIRRSRRFESAARYQVEFAGGRRVVIPTGWGRPESHHGLIRRHHFADKASRGDLGEASLPERRGRCASQRTLAAGCPRKGRRGTRIPKETACAPLRSAPAT